MRVSADRLLRWSPLQAAARLRFGRTPFVLAYHDVPDPARFEAQMAWLARHRHPVTPDALLAWLRRERDLPRNAVLVTFDDGHRSVLEHGLPALRRHAIPAVCFVVSGVVGTDEPLWFEAARAWLDAGSRLPEDAGADAPAVMRRLKGLPDAERREALARWRDLAPACRVPQLTPEELRTLEAGGVEIGNHTATHPLLDRCDATTAVGEVRAAHDALAAWLGRPPRLFAYPNGNADERLVPSLEALGYAAAFLFDHRVTQRAPRYRLSRVRVNATTPPDRFATILSGLHPTLHHLRGRT